MSLRYLITGGCGFIGANLARFLVAKGHSVTVMDNLSVGGADSLFGVDVELLQGDVRDQTVATNAAMNQDIVVHLAASSGVVQSIEDPRVCVEENVLGTLNVLTAARDARVKRLVFASTCGALFGNIEPPVDETTIPAPVSPYGASKLACEALCSAFAGSYGLETVILRFGNIYGPFLGHKKTAVREFLYAAKDGRPVVIYGDGKQTRDYLYVGDLVEAIDSAARRPDSAGGVFHLASGVETSILNLVQAVREVTEQEDLPAVFQSGRRGEVRRTFTRIDRAERMLGFRPRFNLHEGLRETWSWLQSRSAGSKSDLG